MKSDIQIAQEAEMLPIKEVAEKLGIGEDDLELYGKSNSGWRGKNNDKCGTWTGIWPFGEKGSDRIA